MRLSVEQKFLYSRIAVLVAGAGAVVAAGAGFYGAPFWHGPFALAFWFALALLNAPYKTSLWMLIHRRTPFLMFYGALVGSLLLLDSFALRLHLWFYPLYAGAGFIFVYTVLYPAVALAQIEFFYFVMRRLQGLPFIREPKETAVHTVVDQGEGVAFLFMMFIVILGAAGYPLPLHAFLVVSTLWLGAVMVKFGFHLAYPAHLVALALAAALAVVNGIPGVTPFEWVFSEASVLNVALLSIPIWVWLGSLLFFLFTLRLWMFLMLHPRVT